MHVIAAFESRFQPNRHNSALKSFLRTEHSYETESQLLQEGMEKNLFTIPE